MGVNFGCGVALVARLVVGGSGSAAIAVVVAEKKKVDCVEAPQCQSPLLLVILTYCHPTNTAALMPMIPQSTSSPVGVNLAGSCCWRPWRCLRRACEHFESAKTFPFFPSHSSPYQFT